MISLVLYAVCVTLILFVVRELKPEFSELGGVFATVIIAQAILRLFHTVLSELERYSQYGINEYLNVLLKVAGVCICVDVGADLCAQCGYPSVSKGVLIYGKAYLLVLLLPYIERLISGVASFF